jgi:putative molybdopterin biosynthesis protein
MTRNVYLKMETLEKARGILRREFMNTAPLDGVPAEVVDSVGRVLARHVTAKLSSPAFHAAAMDGIAVKAASTFGASEMNPRELRIGESAFYINTGRVMPEGTDAVIMIENVIPVDSEVVQIEGPAFPWQHVRKMGEDIVATELLFPQNHIITPYCVGALLSGGVFEVEVRQKPRVLIIPTGSELIDWQKQPVDRLEPGQVLETNSFVLGKLVESCGGVFYRHESVMDDIGKIEQAIQDAITEGYQMVLTVGGSSAGSEDYAKQVISRLGEVLVHGVTIMPGKPVIIGKVDRIPIFGIPGYPVSAIVAFEQFVQPLICHMLGKPEPEREKISVVPSRKIASRLGVEEFVRIKLGLVGESVVATPLPRGAGCITSITDADGIVRIPNDMEGIRESEPVEAELLKPRTSVDNTIVIVGSHDNTLDVLADCVRARHPMLTISSSHVGSMGGLMAIKRGGCHLAGSHLLDTEDGSYNLSYIRRLLPDIPVRVVQLVFREQGLIVKRGNPKGIRTIEDLCRKDIVLINRQAGSGTRILLDYRLKELEIDPARIRGYENDEFTHMSVAAAVLSDRADAGMGIQAAAGALGLDFIPIVTEQYDLVIPQLFFENTTIQILLDTICSREFRERAEALGGYDTRRTGEIIL